MTIFSFARLLQVSYPSLRRRRLSLCPEPLIAIVGMIRHRRFV